MNKTLIEKSFRRSVTSYATHAHVQRSISDQIARLLEDNLQSNEMKRVLEIGCGSGFLTQHLASLFPTSSLVINDLNDSWLPSLHLFLKDRKWEFVGGDAESFPFSGSFDLITSASTIQWFENPSRFLNLAFQHLSSKGAIVLNTFGDRNFHELRSITGLGLNYPSIDDLLSLLPEYSRVEWSEEEVVINFESSFKVLDHLRQTGVNGLSSQTWTKGKLKEFDECYRRLCEASPSIHLTYHPIFIQIFNY